MLDSKRVLSDIIVFQKYAKYLPELNRRETWAEITKRMVDMFVKKYPQLEQEIIQVFNDFVLTKKVLPSMRMAQFAGKPIELAPNRGYNCTAVSVDHISVFPEILFLLLCGSGVGYSIQYHHIEKLPTIKKPGKPRRYLISDSIEGWADAIKALTKAYFYGKSFPNFDYSDIRPLGAPLKTSGGKAPGPEPLKTCIHHIQMIFERQEVGSQLRPIDVHDIICHIANSVRSGGIRRSSCIALFSIDDIEMLTCKSGEWYIENPQRAMANNSAVILRHRVTKQDFYDLFQKIKDSNAGEPGVFFSNNSEYLANPCMEISLKSSQMCNLTELNVSDIVSQDDLNARAKAASFVGTLQAGFTNFHYLRDIWKKNVEKDALLGVSMTGIASNAYTNLNIKEAAQAVIEENKRVASIIGINQAARSTCIKPSGTASLLLGTSSGIHAWYAPYYIRRVSLEKKHPLYKYLKDNMPELIEDKKSSPHKEAFITIPIKAPDGAITSRSESAIELLEKIKEFNINWIKPGHMKGDNTNNISSTVYVKDDEWEQVRDWMWNNKDYYNGISLLPFDCGSYVQTPFEEISREKYETMFGFVREVDLTQVVEFNNNTNQQGEVACSGGICELIF